LTSAGQLEVILPIREICGMKLDKLSNGLVATVLAAAITSAAASYIVLCYSLPTVGALPASVERIARDYLTKNPEILVQMTTELEKRQAFEQQHQAARRQQKTIFENADAIFRSPVANVAGNPNGDVSVVEFFDYNCGYCRRALSDVVKLVNEDGKVRLVLKELPIFGDDSVAAAKLALASNKQGKYFQMHQKLLSEHGAANEAKALQVAKELGLDVDKLKKDAEDPDIKNALDEAKGLAHKLQGAPLSTPYYVIGDQVLDAVSDRFFDELKAVVAEVRRRGCAGPC
jgi:protein-disulfide isomerase